MNFIRTTAYVLLTGFILAFYSEWMFWSGRPLEPDALFSWLPTWLLYSFITFLFLATAQYFRVRNVWAIFLAGGLYGWLLEGVIVQTTYDSFPLNISFTALAWHAIISGLVGWYWLPRWMQSNSKKATIACLLIGLCLGVWSVGWWAETPVAPLESVFLYNFGFALGLMAAYVGQSRLSFRPNRYAVYVAMGLLAVYFVFVTVPTQPLALVVMPILLIVTLVTLRRNRRHEPETEMRMPEPLRMRQTLPILLIPLVGSGIYALAAVTGLSLPGLQIAYFILMPTGFLLFFVSVYRVWKRRGVEGFQRA